MGRGVLKSESNNVMKFGVRQCQRGALFTRAMTKEFTEQQQTEFLTNNGSNSHLLVALQMREMPALTPPASSDEYNIGGGCDIVVDGRGRRQ